MVEEKEAVGNPFYRELFDTTIYKRRQGRIARQLTFVGFLVLALLGVWRIYVMMELRNVDQNVRYIVPGILAIAGIWFCYRLVNMARFADFLIAVEAEMAKVSWPSRGELVRSSIVVIFVIVTLALALYLYDLLWVTLFTLLGVIGKGA